MARSTKQLPGAAAWLLLSLAGTLQTSDGFVIHWGNSTTARPSVSDLAVGINTGALRSAFFLEVLRGTFLQELPNVIVMAERADSSRGVRGVPPEFYCGEESEWQRHPEDGSLEWGKKGRCTQLRFLYLLLTLREEFPSASYYLLLDDDVWLDVPGLQDLLQQHSPNEPWLMGPQSPCPGSMVYGSVLVLSREIVRRLDRPSLLRAASHYEFACNGKGCCDCDNELGFRLEVDKADASKLHPVFLNVPADSPGCYDETERWFSICDAALAAGCGNSTTTKDLAACSLAMAEEQANLSYCAFNETRPESNGPMYYFRRNWPPNQFHGDDHILGFAVRAIGAAKLIPQRRFSWEPQSTVCKSPRSILSAHHMEPEQIRALHQRWMTAQPC